LPLIGQYINSLMTMSPIQIALLFAPGVLVGERVKIIRAGPATAIGNAVGLRPELPASEYPAVCRVDEITASRPPVERETELAIGEGYKPAGPLRCHRNDTFSCSIIRQNTARNVTLFVL